MIADSFVHTWIWPAGGSGGIWGDVVGSLVWVVIAGSVTVIIWPHLRHIVERSLGLTRLHAKLDHIILHHPDIPPFEGPSTTASAETSGAATPTITKEPPPMSLLDDIEKRFTTSADRVVSDVEAAARSHIGQTLLGAAKEIIPLLPEGREASLVITKLEEVESWAHRALVAGAGAVNAAETVTSEVAPAAPAAPAETAAAPAEPTDPPPPAA